MGYEPLTIRLKHEREETHGRSEEHEPQLKKPRRNRSALIVWVAAAVIALAAALAGWIAYSSAHNASQPQNTQDVVARVGKLMVLPDETPTIAVVSDLSKLQGQAFFANAHQGDIVLLYANAKKAILYSPSLNKIVEDAPITNGELQTQ